jgi:hypothetical protein
MKPNSLGFQTEVLLRQVEGEVFERPEYLVLRTPQNPGYRWGNFLIFQKPPESGDLETWQGVFAKEIGASFHPFILTFYSGYYIRRYQYEALRSNTLKAFDFT